MVHAHGFFEAIKSKTLDINLEENPFPELAAIRTLITAYKLNYALSRRLARYVIHYTNRTPFEQLVHIQFSHYGFARFDTNIIHNWVSAVRNQVGTQSVVRIPSVKPTQILLWSERDPGRKESIHATSAPLP